MTLGPSKSVSRAADGKIYGWSGNYSLTSSAVTLLDYTNPAAFYLTRVTLGIDWSGISAGEVLSYTINVDGQALFVEKLIVANANIGHYLVIRILFSHIRPDTPLRDTK